MKKNFFILIAVISAFSLSAAPLHAQKKQNRNLKLCVKKDTIVAKEKCKKDEKPLVKTNSGIIISNAPAIKGPKGPAGFSGASGSQGPPGLPGRSSFEPLRNGNGAFGLVGGDYNGDGDGTECAEIRYPTPLTSDDYPAVLVRNGVIEVYCLANESRFNSCCSFSSTESCFSETVEDDSRCTGSPSNPSASGGALCVYPSFITNAVTPNINFKDRYGFKVCWAKDGLAGSSSIFSSWAISTP